MREAEGGTASAAVAAVGEIAAWTVVLFAVTMVSLASVDPVEIAVAAGGACGGALAARAIRRAMGAGPGGGRGMLRAVAALTWTLPRGALLLARAAFAGRDRRGDQPGEGAGRPGARRRAVSRPARCGTSSSRWAC